MLSSLIKFILNTPIGNYFRKKFVGGETIKDAIKTSLELQNQNFRVMLHYFAKEKNVKPKDAKKVVEVHRNLLKTMLNSGGKADISLKLSNFGLLEDFWNVGYKLEDDFVDLVREFTSHNIFVWIDAEELIYRDRTFEIVKKICHFGNIGVCVQAYTKDAECFLERLSKLKGVNGVRICKGAYKEKSVNVFKRRKDIKKSFIELFKLAMRKELRRVQVATHDINIVGFGVILPDECAVLYGRHKSKNIEFLMYIQTIVFVYLGFGPKENSIDFLARRIKEKPSYLLFPFKN